jgi:hypothetical protein
VSRNDDDGADETKVSAYGQSFETPEPQPVSVNTTIGASTTNWKINRNSMPRPGQRARSYRNESEQSVAAQYVLKYTVDQKYKKHPIWGSNP